MNGLNEGVAPLATKPVVPVNFWGRVRSGAKTVVVVGVSVGTAVAVHAQTDATAIATNANAAFLIVAPVCVTIAGFFVILRITKRTGR